MTEKDVQELYKFANYVIHKNNMIFDEDILQDLVTYASSIYNKYDCQKALKSTYLIRSMDNHYKDILRKEAAQKKIPKNIIFNLDKNISEDTFKTYLDNIADKGSNCDLKCFLAEIRPLLIKETQLYFSGLKYREIANLEGISISRAQAKVKKNLKNIIEYLKEKNIYDYYCEKLLIEEVNK